MSKIGNGVVVAHPGKQNAYQVVLAIQRAGLLRRFITGIYFKPGEFPYTLARKFPPGLRERALRALSKRRLTAIDDRFIKSIPYFEALSRTVGGLPILARLTEGQSGYWFWNWANDCYVRQWLSRCSPLPAVVYAFLGSALRTFQGAAALGITRVLDVPITLSAPTIIGKEKQRLGMSARFTNLGPRLRAEVHAADYVVAPSAAVAESVIVQGISPKRVFVVPFGVDVGQFFPAPPGVRKDEATFRVLFVGKFDLRKGVHHLLESWKELALPKGELVIVGEPSEPDYAQAMHTKYRGLFVHSGNVPLNELANFYAQADVFVFPSLAEGSALVTYEALASGLPCIVTHEAGSVVRNGVEGFVVPVGDIQALGNRIRQLYQDRPLRQEMAIAARQRAEEFSWQKYHARLVEVLNKVMAEGQYAHRRDDAYAT